MDIKPGAFHPIQAILSYRLGFHCDVHGYAVDYQAEAKSYQSEGQRAGFAFGGPGGTRGASFTCRLAGSTILG